jgi:hypothetical protein
LDQYIIHLEKLCYIYTLLQHYHNAKNNLKQNTDTIFIAKIELIQITLTLAQMKTNCDDSTVHSPLYNSSRFNFAIFSSDAYFLNDAIFFKLRNFFKQLQEIMTTPEKYDSNAGKLKKLLQFRDPFTKRQIG